jgi:hypothetical protein
LYSPKQLMMMMKTKQYERLKACDLLGITQKLSF